MPNPETGDLLLNVTLESKKSPSTVMLGHISSQRNEPELAFRETVKVFEKSGSQINFNLFTAPLKQCSEIIEIG